MIIHGYGISLKRLTVNDIEYVRQMRNSEHITRYMVFNQHITAEMQEKWFHSVNNIHNFYCVILFEGEMVGMINGADVDWTTNETRSGGIFIWKENLWQTSVPLLASVLLMELSIAMGIKKTYVKIRKDNQRAIFYNSLLGYEKIPDSGNEVTDEYVLHAQTYREKTNAVRNYLGKVSDNAIEVHIDDPENPITQYLLEKLKEGDPQDRKRIKVIFD